MRSTSAVRAGLKTLAIATTLIAGNAVAATDSNTSVTAPTHSKKKTSHHLKKAMLLAENETAKEGTTSGAGKAVDKTATADSPRAASESSESDQIKSTSSAPVETQGQSVLNSPEWGHTLADRMVLFDYSTYYGGAPGNWNLNSPNEDGTSSPQTIDNAVTVGYRMNPTTYIGMAVNFLYRPVNGNDIMLEDPAIKLANSALIKTGSWQLYTDLRAYLPVQNSSKLVDQVVQLRSVQSLTYEIKGTKWTLGSYGSLRYFLYSDNLKQAANGGLPVYAAKQRFVPYIGPNVNYQMTPTLSIFVLGEAQTVNTYGTNLTSWGTNEWDLEPGLSWDITPKINFNPFINIYPSSPSVAKTMYLGANLLIKVL